MEKVGTTRAIGPRINPTFTMKTTRFLSLVLVAGTAGLAAFGLANTEFAARLPLESFLAATTSLALVRFAFSDYARRMKPLTVPVATLLRPAPRRAVRVAACAERVAA
jgi:hypothetical protein